MSYRLAPYEQSMRLGQGFESLTQEIRANGPVVVSACPIALDSPPKKDPARVEKEFSSDTESFSSDILTPDSSERESLDGTVENEEIPEFPKSRGNTTPVVAYVARFVHNASDVTTPMGLTGGAAILIYSDPAAAHSRQFDFGHYFDADLNYHVSVRVITGETNSPASTPTKGTWIDEPNQRYKFGDRFISGFVEGGQVDVLLSFQLRDKRKRTKAIAAIETAFKSYPEYLPDTTDLDNAFDTIAETCETTIQTKQIGGTPFQLSREAFTPESLHEALLNFYDRVLERPRPIFAILSTYDSVKAPAGGPPASPSVSLIRSGREALHANMLFDAYMELRDVHRALSAQMAGIEAGTMEFHREADDKVYTGFDRTPAGLASAKRQCAMLMMRIIEELESMATAAGGEGEFPHATIRDAADLRESLPPVRALRLDADQMTDSFRSLVLLVGDGNWNGGLLFEEEREKIEGLVAEHPGIVHHARLARPCGAEGIGSVFCSMDFFKHDWMVAAIGVQVAGGFVSAITVRYTNGFLSEFGPRRKGGKLIELELDLSQQEKVVACSIETGRRVHEKSSRVRVTAVRITTNRSSVLMGQPDDWEAPVEGKSARGSLDFQDLQMTHYDPLLPGGHVVGFWGRSTPVPYGDAGIYRLAPAWSTCYVSQTDWTALRSIVEDQPEHGCLPSGVWDTRTVRAWESPMQRTHAAIEYAYPFLEECLPSIMVGVKMIGTSGGANLRFDAVAESVTASSFDIGVEQWSDSLVYGGKFSWIGIPQNLRGVQAGKFICHSSSTQRHISFARPFSAVPKVLLWISGLDLKICNGKKVSVKASNVSTKNFRLDISGIGTSIKYATISWIAVHEDSPCLTGSLSVTDIQKDDDAQGYSCFPAGKFTTPPTVLTAFRSFELGGAPGNHPRLGTDSWDETESGFSWKGFKWGNGSIRSATVDWIAIPAQ